jgi:hypothetical protein
MDFVIPRDLTDYFIINSASISPESKTVYFGGIAFIENESGVKG